MIQSRAFGIDLFPEARKYRHYHNNITVNGQPPERRRRPLATAGRQFHQRQVPRKTRTGPHGWMVPPGWKRPAARLLI